MAKTNYLNNKDFLAEIHKSKVSYSCFLSPEYSTYDGIVEDESQITREYIEGLRIKRASKMKADEIARQKNEGVKSPVVADIDPETIPYDSIIVRVMTFEHIPKLEEVKNKKTMKESDYYVKLNFVPFKHVVVEDIDTMTTKLVGRSHWKDGLHNGHFSQTHGQITNKLAMMYIKLTDRYATVNNWRNYSYIDEMKARALLQLSTVGLVFNEAKGDNPFAYYTVITDNAFKHIQNNEKRVQKIRDDLLIQSGVAPSMTRQIENELAQKEQGDL